MQDPNGFWRDIAVKEYAWQTEPHEHHYTSNFDVRKASAAAQAPARWSCCHMVWRPSQPCRFWYPRRLHMPLLMPRPIQPADFLANMCTPLKSTAAHLLPETSAGQGVLALVPRWQDQHVLQLPGPPRGALLSS